jgi:hypothetical protein
MKRDLNSHGYSTCRSRAVLASLGSLSDAKLKELNGIAHEVYRHITTLQEEREIVDVLGAILREERRRNLPAELEHIDSETQRVRAWEAGYQRRTELGKLTKQRKLVVTALSEAEQHVAQDTKNLLAFVARHRMASRMANC